jgi:hypothetical protein
MQQEKDHAASMPQLLHDPNNASIIAATSKRVCNTFEAISKRVCNTLLQDRKSFTTHCCNIQESMQHDVNSHLVFALVTCSLGDLALKSEVVLQRYSNVHITKNW